METKSVTSAKFTTQSRGWSEREYKDLNGLMERRADLVRYWGANLQPGDRILELGCGDGSLACVLAAQGFDVTGVDISPGMIDEARQRSSRLGVSARFEVIDSDAFETGEPFDAVISFMSAFFTYLENPLAFLERVTPRVRKKVIVDWNFRSPFTFVEAAQLLEQAGLERVEWRPWLVPYTTRHISGLGFRDWLEGRPNLSLLLLILKRWHYTVHLKGEKRNGRSTSARKHADRYFKGSVIPGSMMQRGLERLGRITR
jgi:2-polyprenyl-3-methyl-5-hydroxy-6-metoxy-1,4-benzoquinol methylase